jgi:peroxiredoxin
MPDFELADQSGRPFRLADELADGAVALVFLRGDW